jgi:hypothetical protein
MEAATYFHKVYLLAGLMVNESLLEKHPPADGRFIFLLLEPLVSLITSYRTWNAAGCLISFSSLSFCALCLFPFALLSNKAAMNLIKKTLIINFITYTPFSSHLKFLFFMLTGLTYTNKKARSFCRPGFLFDACFLQFR